MSAPQSKMIPVLLTVSALLLAVIFLWRGNAEQAGNLKKRTSSRASLATSSKSEIGLDPNRKPRVYNVSVAQRTKDFPHNLKTFTDWGEISANDMRDYRTSLISRIGRWDAAEVGAFFYRSRVSIKDIAALKDFQSAILGLWCAKDADGCVASLEEHFQGEQREQVMRHALAGWGEQDWMLALRYLRRWGDHVIEQRLGGDSSEYVKNLVQQVAGDNGFSEAQEVASLLRTESNRAAAAAALAEIYP